MQRISQFTLLETDVNILYRNGQLGYTFEKDGKTFGSKVKLESKSIQDVASATFLLLTNCLETIEAVKKL